MFGHDDMRNIQGGDPGSPVDDGTLGMPVQDNGAMMAGEPGVGAYDQTAPSLTLPSSQPQNTPIGPVTTDDGNDLINIKQDALQQLKPLVGHLDLTPEERFRTTMMMIQAADDQSLIPQAYDAAKAITDEKARAQALLDVVNEINYFTTQSLKS